MSTNPNKKFKDKQPEERPWDYYYDCISFATDDCEGDCECCDAPKDQIELLCEAKW